MAKSSMVHTMASAGWALAAALIALSACADAGGGDDGSNETPAGSTGTPSATSASGTLPLLPLRARGNEPFWSLEIDSSAMTFRPMDAEPSTSAWRVESDAGSARYVAADSGSALVVTVSDRLCHDSMSGMPHPFEVTVEVGGQQQPGCGGEPRTLLVGGDWIVTMIDGATVVEGMAPTLRFTEDGGVTGDAGCNRFTGTFALSGEGLTFSPLGVTRRACAGTVMEQEASYLDVLAAVVRFDIPQDGELRLEADDGRAIRLRR